MSAQQQQQQQSVISNSSITSNWSVGHAQGAGNNATQSSGSVVPPNVKRPTTPPPFIDSQASQKAQDDQQQLHRANTTGTFVHHEGPPTRANAANNTPAAGAVGVNTSSVVATPSSSVTKHANNTQTTPAASTPAAAATTNSSAIVVDKEPAPVTIAEFCRYHDVTEEEVRRLNPNLADVDTYQPLPANTQLNLPPLAATAPSTTQPQPDQSLVHNTSLHTNPSPSPSMSVPNDQQQPAAHDVSPIQQQHSLNNTPTSSITKRTPSSSATNRPAPPHSKPVGPEPPEGSPVKPPPSSRPSPALLALRRAGNTALAGIKFQNALKRASSSPQRQQQQQQDVSRPLELETPSHDNGVTTRTGTDGVAATTTTSKVGGHGNVIDVAVIVQVPPAGGIYPQQSPTDEVRVNNVNIQTTTVRRLLQLVLKAINFVPSSRGALQLTRPSTGNAVVGSREETVLLREDMLLVDCGVLGAQGDDGLVVLAWVDEPTSPTTTLSQRVAIPHHHSMETNGGSYGSKPTMDLTTSAMTSFGGAAGSTPARYPSNGASPSLMSHRVMDTSGFRDAVAAPIAFAEVSSFKPMEATPSPSAAAEAYRLRQQLYTSTPRDVQPSSSSVFASTNAVQEEANVPKIREMAMPGQSLVFTPTGPQPSPRRFPPRPDIDRYAGTQSSTLSPTRVRMAPPPNPASNALMAIQEASYTSSSTRRSPSPKLKPPPPPPPPLTDEERLDNVVLHRHVSPLRAASPAASMTPAVTASPYGIVASSSPLRDRAYGASSQLSPPRLSSEAPSFYGGGVGGLNASAAVEVGGEVLVPTTPEEQKLADEILAIRRALDVYRHQQCC